MSLFSNKQQPEVEVDLDHLEEEIRREPTASRYAPPRPRQPEPPLIPLNIIAQAVIRLTWADAVEMGEKIKAKLKGDVHDVDLTAAIQAWAMEVSNQ
jgi:hypothetical protein